MYTFLLVYCSVSFEGIRGPGARVSPDAHVCAGVARGSRGGRAGVARGQADVDTNGPVQYRTLTFTNASRLMG